VNEPARILAELERVFACLEPAPLDALARRIDTARRIVCAGQGRSGLIAAAFAVRLGHLGVDAHVAGEPSQPPVGPGDLLIAFSRSGETSVTRHQAERALTAGAGVAVITARDDGALARGADPLVVLPAVESRQHAGSLFEQAALIACDALAATLQAARGLSDDALAARHDNLQ
jgi:6-phospho-3-hexuloisomerase